MDERNIAELNTVKLKKKLNKPALILGITTLLCAGTAAFFGIQYFTKTPAEQIEGENISEIPEKVVETITVNTMAEDYKEVEDVIKTLTYGIANNWDYIENGSGLTYKPDWAHTYLVTKLTLFVKVNNSDSNEVNVATIKSKFENAGFKSVGTLPFLGSAGPQIDGYLNSNKNIICGIYSDAGWTGSGDNFNEYTLLECAKTDWLWLTEEDKTLVVQLEEAYHDKTGEYPRILYGLNNKIVDSTFKPYQTLNISVGGAAGLFYRVDRNAKWQYFTSAQGVLSCSEYNTEDLRRAYQGSGCMDGQVNSKVQP